MTLPEDLNEDGVELLRASVVQQACRDYVSLLKYGHAANACSPGSGGHLVSVQFLEWFFRSKWFTLWSDSDGNYLLKRLRRMCNV